MELKRIKMSKLIGDMSKLATIGDKLESPVRKPKRKLPQTTIDFYQGMMAALAVVYLHDDETVYHEIIATADENELITVAIDSEDAEWCGLIKYGYVTKDGKRKKSKRES